MAELKRCLQERPLRMEKKKLKKIVVAGLGNILLKDEGAGVYVIRKLMELSFPERVELVDGGVASMGLLPLIESAEKIIVIDTLKTDDEPGSIYRLTDKELEYGSDARRVSLHQLTFTETLKIASYLGAKPEVVIFGIVPKDYSSFGMELTPEISSKVETLVNLVKQEIDLSLHKGMAPELLY